MTTRSIRWSARIVAAAVIAAATCASAQAPFANADIVAGKALHDRDCIGCHAQRYGGDASKMYTRADHRVRSVAQLRAQVAVCDSQLSKKYFPDEEENVAAYLNREYYHFTQ
jgi:mono/diheme cytochrome c family protein